MFKKQEKLRKLNGNLQKFYMDQLDVLSWKAFPNFFVVIIPKSLIQRIKKVNNFSDFSEKNVDESFRF